MNSTAQAIRVRDRNGAIAWKALVSNWARSGMSSDKLFQVYDTNPEKVKAMTGGGPINRCETRLAATLFGKSHITAGIAIGLFDRGLVRQAQGSRQPASWRLAFAEAETAGPACPTEHGKHTAGRHFF
jgi:hypothetical protein